MKKGFTMIELIFVIVILGVLASVAIPRLAATRDDAEVAKAATNLATAVSDITAYYTAKGSFTSGSNGTGTTITDFTKMTNALTKDGKLQMKGQVCAEIKLPTNGGGNTQSSKVEITISFTGNDSACNTLKKLSSVKQMCGKAASENISSKNCKIQVGGSGGIAW